MDRRIIYQQSVRRAENPDLQFHLDRLEKLEMIQQLAVLNEEKELLKELHQCNRHNFQDFQKFLYVQRFGLFRGHRRRVIPKGIFDSITGLI